MWPFLYLVDQFSLQLFAQDQRLVCMSFLFYGLFLLVVFSLILINGQTLNEFPISFLFFKNEKEI